MKRMRLHERYSITTKAKLDIGQAVSDAIEKYELTPAETARILMGEAQNWITYILRYERHGNYDTKADEE